MFDKNFLPNGLGRRPGRVGRVAVVGVSFCLVVAACTGVPAAAPSSAGPSSAMPLPTASSEEEFKVGLCSALEAMWRAIGNPETGSGSELSDALDAAVAAGDGATAERLAAQTIGLFESGRKQIAYAAGWAPAATMMTQLDHMFVAFERMAAAKVAVARGTPGAAVPQTVLEQAGGVDAFYAMIEAARALPPGTWQRCFDVFNHAKAAAPSAASAEPAASPVDWSRVAMDELFQGIGNPDTDSKSVAWTAFERALTSGDETLIRSTADVVLSHLSAGRAAVARAAASPLETPRVIPPPTPPPVPWDFPTEWDAMFVAISDGVAMMRDGTISGSAAIVQAGRTRMNNGLLDHFYPSRDWTMPDGRMFRASGVRLNDPPANAFDGRAASAWTAGDRPLPQWVQVDFGAPVTVATIRLLVAQATPGVTLHRVTGGGATGTETLLAEFRGSTRDGEWLTQTLPAPLTGIRYVRVTTLESPSIVAWREVQVLAPGETPPPLATPPPIATRAPLVLIGPSFEAPSALPEGFHDGSTSGVAAGDRCYANGWASDPDDRSKDVTVRILADGMEVWRGPAGDPRPDLKSAGIGDGTVSFWVDLRGLINLAVPHQIRVQARDLESDRWVDLGETPRTITCT